MSQEKKNIRVLSPHKKSKKISPWMSGVLGITLGIAITSAIFLTYSMSNSPGTITQDAATDLAREDLSVDNITRSNKTQLDESAESENDDYHAAQPQIHELTHIFKHQQPQTSNVTAAPNQATQPAATSNPFENAFGSPKPATTASSTVTSNTKQPHVAAINHRKPVLPETNKKPEELSKAEQTAARTAVQAKKDKAHVNIDENVEVPKASVEISVTRVVKEQKDSSP